MDSPKIKHWDFVGFSLPVWVDVPEFKELQAAPYLGAIGAELERLLQSYHALNKCELSTFDLREAKLRSLHEWLQACEASESLSPWINWLATLANGKAAYLASLRLILTEAWHEEEKLRSYIEDCTELRDTRLEPLFLTKEAYVFPERSTFWGDFWMECLDPCHRRLAHMHRVWKSQSKEGRLAPYLLWLESFSSYLHDDWVRYFSPEEADASQIKIVEGHLHNLRGRPLSCPERQHFIFVIDLKKRLFVSRAEAHICHASFTRGQAVLAAGVLQAREGQLTHLKFESGHYLNGPSHWWQAIELLDEMGLHWGEKIRLTVFDRYRYISTLAKSSSLLSKVAFLSSLGLKSQP